MLIKVETFKGESYVVMDVNPINLMVTVKKYGYGGELLEKMSFDTRYAADTFFQKCCDELEKDFE